MEKNELIRLALECGANKAAVIAQQQIELDEKYRRICEGNSCGSYGRCWMCPPDIGSIQENMAQIRAFSHGLIYQTIGELEDSFDFEGMAQSQKKHSLVSQKLHTAAKLRLGENMLHLGVGGCGLCERCTKTDGLPCRFPDRALPAMEGYGIGVAGTLKDTGLQYINGQNTVTYFGLLLFNEGENE